MKDFQSITIECMLVGSGRFAWEGAQAGVKGITYHADGQDSSVSNPIFTATGAGGSPGYMVGPPSWYGNLSVPDVSSSIPNNGFSLAPVRAQA